jgi:hypothetical protein
MARMASVVVLAGFVAVQVASGIDYKKSVIAGGGGTTRATFKSFSSSFTMGGTNTTTVTSSSPSPNFQLGDFKWPDGFGTKQTLEARIRAAEQALYKLYFIRDVCRTLEDEITIVFEKKDIREVLKQVSTIKKVDIPFDVPEGEFMVETSDVSGMPTDQFLSSVASVCGLALQYTPTKLLFVKPDSK